MKKIILTLMIVLTAYSYSVSQNQFYGVDTEKFITLVHQSSKMPYKNSIMIVDQAMTVLSTNPKSYRKALEIAEQRIGNPSDSLHNEQLYLTILKNASKSYVLSNTEKERINALIEIATKNQVGSLAKDIVYINVDGKSYHLLENNNKFTLVFFNDPKCDACETIKNKITESAIIKKAIDNGVISIVAINTDNNEKQWKKSKFPSFIINGWDKNQIVSNGAYELPTMPIFYVLGKDNSVLVKNEASFKRLENIVDKLTNNAETDSPTLAAMLFNL